MGVAAAWAYWRKRHDVPRTLIVASAAFWAAVAVSGVLLFPQSRARLAVPLLAAAGVATLAAAPSVRSAWRRWPGRLAVVPAVALGAWMSYGQRAAAPSTVPAADVVIETALAEQRGGGAGNPQDILRFGDGSGFSAASGAVAVRNGPYTIVIEPLLTFISRSPDRCWTIFAPPAARVGPRRVLAGSSATGTSATAFYADDDRSRLAVDWSDASGAVAIDAATRLPGPVYSHLNKYCHVRFSGHRRLFVSFSPCPDRLVEVTESDYPVGRPARLAYLGGDGEFRVVEASSAEKGPYQPLAAGPLRRGEPLEIVFYDETRAVGRVRLDDWSAQAGTDLSPTAGWGLPVNAIELRLRRDAGGSVAHLFVTLAGTSVGRGWDSVGHADGTYRNRMRVEVGPPPDGHDAAGFRQ